MIPGETVSFLFPFSVATRMNFLLLTADIEPNPEWVDDETHGRQWLE